MDKPTTWKTSGRKRTFFTRIKEAFDDTKYQRLGRAKTREILKNAPKQKQIPVSNNYTTAGQIEDYFNTIDLDIRIPVLKPNIKRKEIGLNWTIPKLTIAKKKRKNVKLTLDVLFLKKVALITVIVILPLIAITLMVGYFRMVYWTDADWRASVVNQNYQKDIDMQLTPWKAKLQEVNDRISVIEENKIPIGVTVVKKKYRTIEIKNGKATIQETE
jgi:hypothetical protein